MQVREQKGPCCAISLSVLSEGVLRTVGVPKRKAKEVMQLGLHTESSLDQNFSRSLAKARRGGSAPRRLGPARTAPRGRSESQLGLALVRQATRELQTRSSNPQIRQDQVRLNQSPRSESFLGLEAIRTLSILELGCKPPNSMDSSVVATGRKHPSPMPTTNSNFMVASSCSFSYAPKTCETGI